MAVQDKLHNNHSVRTIPSEALLDAFGRQRISQPETIFDSKQLYDNQPLFWDDQEVSGGSTTSSHSVNTASTTIGVADGVAGKRVRQTFMRFNYQPGKSQLILCTGVLDKSGGGTGITQSFGYFDDQNGIFVRNNEGTVQIVKRSYTSGSAVDTAVDQSDWNIDRLDGSFNNADDHKHNPSKLTLDVTKAQIFFVDIEWLGVGTVRCGFVIDGVIHYVHAFHHSNRISSVYMSTPNLPLRYEIENDGNGGAATLEHICGSVISEGGAQKNGILRHKDSGTLSVSSGAEVVMMAARLKSTHLGLSINIENISFLVKGNAKDGHWELRLGGTPSAALTFNGLTNTGVDVAIGNGSITHSGGTELDGGFVSSVQAAQFNTPNAARPGSAIDGTAQVLYLVFVPDGNTDVEASVTWRELL